MKKEQKYAFREQLLTVHEANVHQSGITAADDEVELYNGVIIAVGNTNDIVIQTAAEDFVDFLKVSMDVTASVSSQDTPAGKNVISLHLAADCGFDLQDVASYKGFCIRVTDGIEIFGHDSRGIAEALHYMEDLMCFKKAPIMKQGEIRKKPMLYPRMVHSGYGLDEFPDEYLNRIAHEGRDAILIFTWDVNKTHTGYLDFNDLIARANRYGIDVYAYSVFINSPHPDDPNAEEFYANTYGKLFRECPGIAGVTLVGEMIEFPSKDPHVSSYGSRCTQRPDLPDGKPWPGWYPCEEFPQWVSMVSKAVRKEKPDADIVLWSYNWGFQPEEARIKLIENLPKDITLQATFEMFDRKQLGDIKTAISDYSLSYVGPSPYFVSEAKAAKRCGIKLYTMSQAGGVTWDFGSIPYEPMPYQWMRRFEKMRQAYHDWGLCGGMETHHHGLYPSIISKFAKHAFLAPEEPMEDILDQIFASEYGKENLKTVQEGFRLWSEAINYYTPTDGELSGAGRIGPSFPLCLYHNARPISDDGALFGGGAISSEYSTLTNDSYFFISREPEETILNLRHFPELESLNTMLDLMKQGIAVFETIENPNEKLQKLLNLGKYLACYMQTIINAKKWYYLKRQLGAASTKEHLHSIADEMEALIYAERDNAASAIPYVEADSRLGWEPTLLYLGDAAHIDWKLRQLQYVLQFELPKLRKTIDF